MVCEMSGPLISPRPAPFYRMGTWSSNHQRDQSNSLTLKTGWTQPSTLSWTVVRHCVPSRSLSPMNLTCFTRSSVVTIGMKQKVTLPAPTSPPAAPIGDMTSRTSGSGTHQALDTPNRCIYTHTHSTVQALTTHCQQHQKCHCCFAKQAGLRIKSSTL